jgi:DNA-binding GntR family transcriptional regulator
MVLLLLPTATIFNEQLTTGTFQTTRIIYFPTTLACVPLKFNHLPLRQVVADTIREMILTGALQPGERLLEDDLAKKLGVSRNPVREAIRSLEATGLVEVQARKGAYVSGLEPNEAIQLLELRSVIEAYAAELAATNRTDLDITKMKDLIEKGKKASADNDLVAASSCHREFHLAIEHAAGNRYLESTVEPLRSQTELIFSRLADRRGVLSWSEHTEIYRAIADGDVKLARKCTINHMMSVTNDLKALTK